jgi:hypothetical protein
MLAVIKPDDVEATSEGIILTVGDKKIFLSWVSVDAIAEASEPYYTAQVLQAHALLNGRSKIN